MNASKQTWRARMRRASACWLESTPVERAQQRAALEKNLSKFLQSAQGIWGGYCAFDTEPPLDIYDHDGPLGSLSAIQWAFPKIEPDAPGEQSPFMRYLIPKTKDAYLSGSLGMIEPDPLKSDEVASGDLSGVLIPALAFDRDGVRLGRGKGYYDRWLSDFSGRKVGVAYSWQIAATPLPREPFDIPMDIIVTENETISSPENQPADLPPVKQEKNR